MLSLYTKYIKLSSKPSQCRPNIFRMNFLKFLIHLAWFELWKKSYFYYTDSCYKLQFFLLMQMESFASHSMCIFIENGKMWGTVLRLFSTAWGVNVQYSLQKLLFVDASSNFFHWLQKMSSNQASCFKTIENNKNSLLWVTNNKSNSLVLTVDDISSLKSTWSCKVPCTRIPSFKCNL